MADVSQGSSQVCKHHPVSTLWDVAGVVKVWYDDINYFFDQSNAEAEMSQGEDGMPPQDLPERAPYFSRAASSGVGQFGTTGRFGLRLQNFQLVNGTAGIEILLVDPGPSAMPDALPQLT